jgi:hypothetical protein
LKYTLYLGFFASNKNNNSNELYRDLKQIFPVWQTLTGKVRRSRGKENMRPNRVCFPVGNMSDPDPACKLTKPVYFEIIYAYLR